MGRAFISIGSNIDPEENMKRAVLMLRDAVRITAISMVYRTDPVGPAGQPLFCNCVLESETDLLPHELKFRLLRGIESRLGRVRGNDKYAPRTIDLDLVLYDDLVLTAEGLTLPDPDIPVRPFLAIPIHELAPGLVLPGSGLSIGEAASKLPQTGMTPLKNYTEQLRKEILS